MGIKYVPALDGLRGLAILLVLMVHFRVPGFPGGFVGVDVFFVLSGYLITSILLAEHDGGGISLRRFYWRRALRLYPALLVLLAVYLAAAPFIWPNHPHWRDALLTGLYLSDYSYPLMQAPKYLSHTWSLAVEEHFYMLWPPLLIVALRHDRERLGRWLLIALFVAIAWRTAMAFPGTYFRTDTRLPGLIAGCWLATANLTLPRKPVAFGSVALLACAVLFAVPNSDWGTRLIVPMAEIAALGLVYSASAWLEYRPLVKLGQLSYGVYLWHVPLMLTFNDFPWAWQVLFVGPLSIGAAWVSFNTVEAWARSARRREVDLRRPEVVKVEIA